MGNFRGLSLPSSLAHPKLFWFILCPLSGPLYQGTGFSRPLPTSVLPWGWTAREARLWKSLGQLKDWIQLHSLSAYCVPCPRQLSHT